jgi:hypothetical protein
MSNLYCQVFVKTKKSEIELINIINDFLKGEIQSRNIDSRHVSLSVIKNKSTDFNCTNDPLDGFLYYPFYLEIEPSESIALDEYIHTVKELITFLRGKGFTIIPSCSFENKLNEDKDYKEFMK